MAASFYQTPLYVFFPALSPSFFLRFLSCLPTFRVPPLKLFLFSKLSFSPILQSHPIPQVPILQRAFRHGLHRMHGLWYSHHRRQQRWPHGVRETGARRPGRRGGRLAHGAGNEEAHGHTVRCSMSSWNLM